ncbi:MAG: sucrose phosphorylase [Lactobacillus amylovorus]|uniref:sucrose phosphorylase n=1 Tax=Lactobacillus amylovorus TaxID=1604 RepID=UPI002A77333F|nr:sucrose phosphorylase [Lactobacillus amylovorus]MDF9461016.1 sucrose phosphorylase [Lactobacillus amylovorus]MDY2786765.1 sucrose phosphorylase [Lactobacillus amylovorus]MDY4730118.1 sucrose phosphorylase [Lactobacillus amylovorus]MDY5443967.1 sucrose phosphorylase [Lactobacillus amylovorus]
MKLQNKAMLITYPDSLGHNLQDLSDVMDKYFKKAIGGIHLLPIFPSNGDRGFSPTRYDVVDPKFGTWQNVEKLGQQYYLMFDFMINHLSKHSEYFQDFQKKHNESKYSDLFLSWDKFWPIGRPTQRDVDLIYKRKDKAPYQEIKFVDGSQEKMWNTFGPDQMDLDVRTKVTQNFIKENLQNLAKHGASLIRLDAFAYAIKKLDTNDFFVEPEIWTLLNQVKDYLKDTPATILPEIHEHYTMPFKVAKHGYFIYDFALPMVLLYSLYSGDSTQLAKWLKKCPMKQFTTLDTHDGLGVVDAKDVLTDEQIDYTTKKLYQIGANVKKKYSSAEYHNLDIYQINTTYYSALGNDDRRYFLARLLQIFAPGIPQIYYVGLLAGQNDIKLLEKTKEGRDINRHYYELDEIKKEVQRPVVKSLIKLLEFRNSAAAFDLNGSIKIKTPSDHEIIITRTNKENTSVARAYVDLKELKYQVKLDEQVFIF